MASTEILLFLSSCATAIIHAFIPDPRLLFALLARSQSWSERRTATIVTVTLSATRGMRRLDLPFFTRYGDPVSGLLIPGIGVVVMINER